MPIESVLGAVMYKPVPPMPTFTVTRTVAPVESSTLICATPLATPLMVKVVPVPGPVTVDTPLLLLLAK